MCQAGRLCWSTAGLAAIAACESFGKRHVSCLPSRPSCITPFAFLHSLCLQYLCTGLEDDILRRKLEAATAAEAAGGSKVAALSEVDQLVQACGKMVLLHKLLPKLKAEGHKVRGARGGCLLCSVYCRPVCPAPERALPPSVPSCACVGLAIQPAASRLPT